MGLDYFQSANDIPSAREISVVEGRFFRRDMDALAKTHPFTWYNGSGSAYPPANLDHVFAARHLKFTNTDGTDAVVHVGGWTEGPSEQEKDDWIAAFSDHAPLTMVLDAV